MRKLVIVGLLLIGIVGVAALSGSQEKGSQSDSPMILVELFTSEGCSSCPPADALLAGLAQVSSDTNYTIVPLAFHVDYWNNLGWKDPFSKPPYTQRQYDYASAANTDRVYTPQMIVDGTAAFVGSDRRAALKALKNAASKSKARLTVAISSLSPDAVSLHIAGSGFAAGDAQPNICLAITEDNLQSKITRGENAGKTLHHEGVVRWFDKIDVSWTNGGAIAHDATVPLVEDWRKDQIHVVAFAQDSGTGRVSAVASTPLTR